MTTQEAAELHPEIVDYIKRYCKDATPGDAVKSLTETQFLAAGHFYSLHTKPVQRCLDTRKKRMEAAEERQKADKVLWGKFRAFVHGKVESGGALVHAIASEGKGIYGDYSTKSRVEAAARSCDDLTLRLQPYGDSPDDTALAIFRGVPTVSETLTDQPLPL